MLNPFQLQPTQELENKQFKIVLQHTRKIYISPEHIPTIIATLNRWKTPLLQEEQTEKITNEIKAINLRIASYNGLLENLIKGNKQDKQNSQYQLFT